MNQYQSQQDQSCRKDLVTKLPQACLEDEVPLVTGRGRCGYPQSATVRNRSVIPHCCTAKGKPASFTSQKGQSRGDVPESSWGCYCSYLKLFPAKSLGLGEGWEVGKEIGAEEETVALLETPRQTQTLKPMGVHCWAAV